MRHPHCLMHALGSHLVAGNVNPALVKQALDHRRQAADAVQSALMSIF